MRRSLLTVASVIAFIACWTTASVYGGETARTEAAVSETHFAFNGSDVGTDRIMTAAGLRKLVVVLQRRFDKDGDAFLDDGAVDRIRDESDPDLPIVLDWEGEAIVGLREELNGRGRTDSNAPTIASRYADFVSRVQEGDRRHAGFYGLPPRGWKARRMKVRKLSDDALRLFQGVSAFYPSAYMHRLEGKDAYRFNRDHVESSLLLGCALGKPVHAFVSHRWHPRSRSSAHELVPLRLFAQVIDELGELGTEDCQLAGVVWWSGDFVHARRGREPYERQIGTVEAPLEGYHDTLGEFAAILMERSW